MNLFTPNLPTTLLQARRARRFSQLELSMRLGVSQRHVSFVESGRSKPSRELLLAWLQELDAPLAVRNEAMLQAGFAPAYSAEPLTAPSMVPATDALVQLLKVHDPMPAMVIDAQWNVLQFNRGAHWLLTTLMPWTADLPADTPVNMLDLLAHPKGLTLHMLNLQEKGPAMLAQLRDELAAQPALAPKMEALAALLYSRLGGNIYSLCSHPSAPLLTTHFTTAYGKLAFFSMFSTFGTPQDITLASLRVEHLFAADAATLAVMNTQVGQDVKVSR
ncbi:Helix-turn-helix [Pseudomonas pohangensis]|uniref:Helix-turn-helix n=1 Tax=Pseudomonas pohangensis TaxID=364197 RepID=A0A1H2EVJ4_9PSED|nr:helix-turn-helix domain-containing protein [Pseudomonas pohangensis]SDT99114.1 Helix-turn-helix [Pseudomonas pohangensis]